MQNNKREAYTTNAVVGPHFSIIIQNQVPVGTGRDLSPANYHHLTGRDLSSANYHYLTGCDLSSANYHYLTGRDLTFSKLSLSDRS